jgi:predicted small secreted protein
MRFGGFRYVAALFVTAALLGGCDTAASGSRDDPAASSPSTGAPRSAANLPDGYTWAGGDETGIRFAVPDDWVQREDLSDEVRQRGGVAFLDPIGADIPGLWEAHLIASCDTLRGVTTIEQLEAMRAGHLRQYDNAVVEVLTVGGTDLVRSEYDIEADGKVEHWYAYNLLAGSDWMCAITLVTPLKPTEREHIDAVFDAMAPTIEARS